MIWLIDISMITKLLKENRELDNMPFEAFVESALFYRFLNNIK